jgi:hypothetical protein
MKNIRTIKKNVSNNQKNYLDKKTNSKNTKKANKGQLFSDDNPETTVHGYGFANSKIAQYTIDDLRYRDIDFQFQVVNTMYHRAKEVIKRTKDKSKIQNIKSSLDIFSKWLSNYKSQHLSTKYSFPYMTYKQIKALEFLAEFYDISLKARGLQKPTTSDKGFLPIWKEVKGDKKRLRNYPIKANVPNGQTWDKHRNFFIVRRLSMIKNAKDALYYTSGPFEGLPTKLHVNMMMWGYSPDGKNVISNIKKYKDIISKYNKY